MGPERVEDLRRRAEKQLAEREGRIKTLERADLESLAHELAVHQIELEMQNEELRRTQAQLQETSNRYLDLYDLSPVGYLTVDKHNLILEANLTASRLLGSERPGLIGARFTGFIEPQSAESYYLHRRAALKTQTRQTCEVRMLKQDGAPFEAELQSLPVGDSGQLRIALTDITRRKQLQEEVRVYQQKETVRIADIAIKQSEEKYRRIVETANEGIMIADISGTITFVNPRMAEMLGYSADEMVGKPGLDFVDPSERPAGSVRTEQRKRGTSESYDIKFRHKNGKEVWLHASGTPTKDDKGKHNGNLAMYTDITERKQAEEALVQANDQLKQYGHRITQVQEEERKRIAYELHDDTAQYLSLLKLELDSLLHSKKIQDPQVLEKLKHLEKDAGRAVDEVRRYSHELRPAILDNLGLHAALEQIAEDANKVNQIAVEVDVEGEEPSMPDEVKLGLFRIAQEAINNARKHAKATHATLSLKFLGSKLILTVKDNGIGFDVQEAKVRSKNKGSLGLMSMQERARLLDACLKIESEPGKGTTVSAEVKL